MRDRLFRFIVVVFVFAALGVTAWYLIRLVPRVVRTAFAEKLEKKQNEETLDVLVTQIRELSRLETAAMRIVHISTIDQSYDLVPNRLAGDSLTFMAVGEVIAGIDLSGISREDVRVSPDGIVSLRLPPPRILVTRIDNEQSRVLQRKTGMFRHADPQMESRARQRAEGEIREEAVKKGILPLADRNAERKLADFLHAVGFEKVRFEHTPPPASRE